MTQDARRKTKVKRTSTPQVDLGELAHYFAAQPDVVVAYLFGSFAKGTSHPQSDVDIAILFDARLDTAQRVKREMEIARDLSRFATHKRRALIASGVACVCGSSTALWTPSLHTLSYHKATERRRSGTHNRKPRVNIVHHTARHVRADPNGRENRLQY